MLSRYLRPVVEIVVLSCYFSPVVEIVCCPVISAQQWRSCVAPLSQPSSGDRMLSYYLIPIIEILLWPRYLGRVVEFACCPVISVR